MPSYRGHKNNLSAASGLYYFDNAVLIKYWFCKQLFILSFMINNVPIRGLYKYFEMELGPEILIYFYYGVIYVKSLFHSSPNLEGLLIFL